MQHTTGALQTADGYYLYQQLTPDSGFDISPGFTSRSQLSDGSLIEIKREDKGSIRLIKMNYNDYQEPGKIKVYRINNWDDMLRVRNELFPSGRP